MILDLTGDHPETKALFSAEDWAEMLKSFNQDVKLAHTNTEVPDTMHQFFDKVHNVISNFISCCLFLPSLMVLLDHQQCQ